MSGPRRVGILGGMGPQATVALMQRLIDALPAEDDCDHIPLIVDNNTQVPSRIRALIDGTGEDPGPVLGEMARRLEAAGAKALAMPCNTAHHYAPLIAGAVAIPLLDMVELSAEAALRATGRGGKIGILASPAVRLTGLFNRALAARALIPLYAEDQDQLLAAIRLIKTCGDTPEARAALGAASSELLARGAAVQLIACTEFSIVKRAVAEGATAIDTLDVLVAAIVRFATGPDSEDAPAAPPDGQARQGALKTPLRNQNPRR
jgi:aspartate racemase